MPIFFPPSTRKCLIPRNGRGFNFVLLSSLLGGSLYGCAVSMPASWWSRWTFWPKTMASLQRRFWTMLLSFSRSLSLAPEASTKRLEHFRYCRSKLFLRILNSKYVPKNIATIGYEFYLNKIFANGYGCKRFGNENKSRNELQLFWRTLDPLQEHLVLFICTLQFPFLRENNFVDKLNVFTFLPFFSFFLGIFCEEASSTNYRFHCQHAIKGDTS